MATSDGDERANKLSGPCATARYFRLLPVRAASQGPVVLASALHADMHTQEDAMHKSVGSIEINAPADLVYEFMTTPKNLPSVFPSLMEVSNAKRSPDGAHSFDWIYKMAGVKVKGHSETIENVSGKKIVTKNSGIPGTFFWTYEAKGNRTILSCEAQYTIPTPVLGALAETIIAKMNDHDLETLLRNVKLACEGRASAATTSAVRA